MVQANKSKVIWMDICANSTLGTVGGDTRPCTVLEKGQHWKNECDVVIFQEAALEWNCRRDWFVAGDELCDKCWALHGRTSVSWVSLSCSHATTRTDIKLRYLCVRVGSGGRAAAIPVPVQVHANARSHHASLGSRAPRRKLHSHVGYSDLVPDQHGGKILPSFSIILIVKKWSVMFSRCTTTFHSDGLVNSLYECDFWIGIRCGRHFISTRGGFSWRIFWQTLQRSRSAGPSMLVRYGQCTS